VATRRRRAIAAPAPAARITLRVLADQLGLSPASVSLVLNRAPAARAIPPVTQERIRAAAAASGYRANTIAKSLRHHRTLTIGVLVPEIREGYSALVMSGIADALLQAGYLYFVASHRHRADLVDEYPRLMLDRSVDGLILVDTPIGAPLPVPVVAVSGHGQVEGVTNIVVDHGRVGQLDGNSPLPDLGYMAARALLRVRPRATALFAFNDMADADPAAAV